LVGKGPGEDLHMAISHLSVTEYMLQLVQALKKRGHVLIELVGVHLNEVLGYLGMLLSKRISSESYLDEANHSDASDRDIQGELDDWM
jgi:hypothetical protein